MTFPSKRRDDYPASREGTVVWLTALGYKPMSYPAWNLVLVERKLRPGFVLALAISDNGGHRLAVQ